MSIKKCGLVLAVVFSGFASPAAGQLVNTGQAGEFFYDTSTGLYWYDPAQWVGQTRAAIDAFVQSSSIWNWATTAQVSALNGKSTQSGLPLVSVLGPSQFTLSNGGPRWIGYHSLSTAPDGWLVQSFGSPGFTTIDATGFQNNVITWGPGAWLVSTTAPVVLTLSQPQGSGSLLVHVAAPASSGFGGAVYFTAFSFHPANATAPGLGWWQGLHISLLDLVQQAQTGVAPFLGTLSAAGVADFSLPPNTLSPTLPDVYAVTTLFDVTFTMQLGVTDVASLNIM